MAEYRVNYDQPVFLGMDESVDPTTMEQGLAVLDSGSSFRIGGLRPRAGQAATDVTTLGAAVLCAKQILDRDGVAAVLFADAAGNISTVPSVGLG